MPKQLLKIDQFHGGLSTNDDPRDIAPNELVAARDIQVDELGKIRPLGGAVVHGEVPSAAVTTFVDGYGLFQFSTDHKYSKIVITAIEIPKVKSGLNVKCGIKVSLHFAIFSGSFQVPGKV